MLSLPLLHRKKKIQNRLTSPQELDIPITVTNLATSKYIFYMFLRVNEEKTRSNFILLRRK